MTLLGPVSHSGPPLKSLNFLKLYDVIHSEILSFVYHSFHKVIESSMIFQANIFC